jgi:hypothetical protein
MDETIKVIIATLSGFIIAFFAEPVKTYFQNRLKLQNLRLALYKEMLDNYMTLNSYTSNQIAITTQRDFIARHMIRTECYRHALQHEVALFYQLDEAIRINRLQHSLIRINDMARDEKGLPMKDYLDLAEIFQELFARSMTNGELDRSILKSLTWDKYYREIIQRGLMVSDAKYEKGFS